MNIEEKNWRKSCFLFNWMCKLLLVFIVFISCVSCHTLFKKRAFIPNNLSSYKSGTFSGIVTIYQSKKKRQFTGDIFISKAGKLRMDLSISPGLPVFTLLLNKNNISLLSLRTKEFYDGNNINDVLPSFFPKDLKFSVFKELFFDRKPKGKQWVCEIKKENLPIKCQHQTWRILWKREKKRLLSLSNPEFEFSFQYYSFSSEADENLFDIKIPKNFKRSFLFK